MANGDFADFIEALSAFGVVDSNVGMGSQFSENTFYTNKGISSYHGLLATLHKNLSEGLQFDLNYTYSHSIDNVSLIANSRAVGGYGFICDVVRPTECWQLRLRSEAHHHRRRSLRSAIWPRQDLWRDDAILGQRDPRRLEHQRST